MRRLAACLAAFSLVTAWASPPAGAAALGSYGFDCTVAPNNLTVTAAPGDTFTVDFPGCYVLAYAVMYFTPADFPTPSNMWVGPKVITMDATRAIALSVRDPAIPMFTFKVSFVVGAAPAPAPAPASGDVVPPDLRQVLQQVPPPPGGCGDVQDADLEWGTGLRGGWADSWAAWNGGPVCSRSLQFDGSAWSLG